MEPHRLREEAINLLEGAGVEVRREHLGGSGGGLCRLRERLVLFLDEDADFDTQVEHCLSAVRTLPGIDTMFLSPAMREQL